MSTIWLERKQLFREARKCIQEADVILDIGCGIRPQTLALPKVHICADPYQPYLQRLQQNHLTSQKDRQYIYLQATWEEIIRLFPEKSVDSIFLLDVIEHLEKEEGKQLLADTEKIARKQLIIFTPLGYLPQSHSDGKDNWGMSGGMWQEHKSGWLPEDFDDAYRILASKDFHEVRDNQTHAISKYPAMMAIRSSTAES